MTEFNPKSAKFYVDTALFIYYLEQSSLFFFQARSFFLHCYKKIPLVTSAITIEEYCVYPIENNDYKTVENFNAFISGMDIELVKVDPAIALQAAHLCVKYQDLKPMDAFHLATAMISGCTLFATNDKQLRKTEELPVVTVDKLGSADHKAEAKFLP